MGFIAAKWYRANTGRNHTDGSDGSVDRSGGVVAEHAQELKAVLDLGQRDSVRRLANKVKGLQTRCNAIA